MDARSSPPHRTGLEKERLYVICANCKLHNSTSIDCHLQLYLYFQCRGCFLAIALRTSLPQFCCLVRPYLWTLMCSQQGQTRQCYAINKVSCLRQNPTKTNVKLNTWKWALETAFWSSFMIILSALIFEAAKTHHRTKHALLNLSSWQAYFFSPEQSTNLASGIGHDSVIVHRWVGKWQRLLPGKILLWPQHYSCQHFRLEKAAPFLLPVFLWLLAQCCVAILYLRQWFLPALLLVVATVASRSLAWLEYCMLFFRL